MASLKGDRARAGLSLQMAKPKPLSIQRQAGPDISVNKARAMKAALGGALAAALTFLIADYSGLAGMDTLDALQYIVGLLCIVSLPIYVLYRDLKRYKKAVTTDFGKLVLVCVIIAGTAAVSRFSAEIFSAFTANLGGADRTTAFFAVPIASGAMLATLLFDIHIGILIAVVTSIFGGVMITAEPLYGFYAFLGGMIASFSVIRCGQRSALMKAGLFTALANAAAVICIGLYHHDIFSRAGLYDVLAALSAGFLAAILVSGILPLLESAFKVVTDISLLEYSDLNRPLLKQLMVNAPGTYHHSVIIGSLAEAAAEAVGVNPLMARVAAYYHDIGKIKKPEYFIENQARGENRHDRLTPSMSSLIISSHVKDGCELARAHKLPDQIIDIIQQHHGTALMTYFYEKAREQEKDSQVSREDYRYPGPKPQTKVAAIVMLADTVEAASRVLEDPNPQRIAALVDKLVNRSFEDGQLTDCELTFKDLQEIKRSFNMLLSGIYHHRVDYPGLGIPAGKKNGGNGNKQPEGDKSPAWGAQEGGGVGAVVSGTERGGT